MLRIWIPGYEQAVLKVESFNIFYFVENSFIFCILQENGKPFTVYKIHVATTTGRYFILSKRYSSIHELYLKCKERYFVNVPFPPKKLSNSSTKVCVIRNISFLVLYYFFTFYKILDIRRQELERYLQCLATMDPIPPALAQFLNLEPVTINANSTSK